MLSPWTLREGANSGGPPDFVGRLRQRRPKASLNNSFPNPPKPKEKPAGVKRRACGLRRRCERGTEARRPDRLLPQPSCVRGNPLPVALSDRSAPALHDFGRALSARL